MSLELRDQSLRFAFGHEEACLLGKLGEGVGAKEGGRTIDVRQGVAATTLYDQIKGFFTGCAREMLKDGDQKGAARLAKASTHWLRHTHASHAIANGMPIEIAQQNLGHASLATTTVYVRTEEKRRMKAVKKFWEGTTPITRSSRQPPTQSLRSCIDFVHVSAGQDALERLVIVSLQQVFASRFWPLSLLGKGVKALQEAEIFSAPLIGFALNCWAYIRPTRRFWPNGCRRGRLAGLLAELASHGTCARAGRPYVNRRAGFRFAQNRPIP